MLMMLVLLKIEIIVATTEIIIANFSNRLQSVILNQNDENMIIVIHSSY